MHHIILAYKVIFVKQIPAYEMLEPMQVIVPKVTVGLLPLLGISMARPLFNMVKV
jgi:hypothetical protein